MDYNIKMNIFLLNQITFGLAYCNNMVFLLFNEYKNIKISLETENMLDV